MHKTTTVALIFLAAALAALPALAQITERTRVENARYAFAFTFEAGSLVTYPENGDGFSVIHNSEGGGKGTKPDYGLLVYGTQGHLVSKKEAEAIGLVPAEEQVLMPGDVPTNARLQEIMVVTNGLAGTEPAGDATVKLPGGKAASAKYFMWSRTVGSRTHYALAYVVRHDTGFIHVQAESSRPISKQQERYFTSQLELLAVDSQR